ncbi:MAG: hypothetical protein JXA09_03975 [Anaerolineae bacterium]|nr:hypothetical protein [Anaerolineae bacterium]
MLMSHKDREWIAWLIVVVVTVIGALIGVKFPIPDPPSGDVGIQGVPGGVSNLTGLHVAVPTVVGTATPGLMVDSSSVSNPIEIRDSATPVFAIHDGGTADFMGAQIDLDADNDTSISADTDDQIDIEIGGADEVVLTAAQLDLNDTIVNQDLNTENIGILPSIATATITYTAGAGGSGVVATIGASEIWFIHAIYAHVTTNWDVTAGDDAWVHIGDGDDADGYLDLDDGELQTADTEGTGAPAGWQGFMSTDTRGAYFANGLGFVKGNDTIDWACGATGDDLTAGQLTVYVVYTRIQ